MGNRDHGSEPSQEAIRERVRLYVRLYVRGDEDEGMRVRVQGLASARPVDVGVMCIYEDKEQEI